MALDVFDIATGVLATVQGLNGSDCFTLVYVNIAVQRLRCLVSIFVPQWVPSGSSVIAGTRVNTFVCSQ